MERDSIEIIHYFRIDELFNPFTRCVTKIFSDTVQQGPPVNNVGNKTLFILEGVFLYLALTQKNEHNLSNCCYNDPNGSTTTYRLHMSLDQFSEPDLEFLARITAERLTLSPEAEVAFSHLADVFEQVAPDRLARAFAAAANRDWPVKKRILSEDIASISYTDRPVGVEWFEARSGQAMRRPTFRMSRSEIQNLTSRLTGESSSAGFTIRAGDAGLIFSPNDPMFELHEVRHTCDRFLHERKGDDKVLEEFIGFFGEVLTPRVIRQSVTSRAGPNDMGTEVVTERIIHVNMRQLGAKLKSELHNKQCCPHLDYLRYCKLVDRVTGLLETLAQTYPPTQLDSILFNVRTIGELERLSQLPHVRAIPPQ